jgi:hypothetical protein
MKRFVLAIALTCALMGSALAGEIHSTGAPAPVDIHTTGSPAPDEISTSGTPTPGDIPCDGLSVVLTILDLMF